MAEWQFVSPDQMTLREYPSGFAVGDRVRLLKELVIRDHKGRPSGKVHPAGEVWAVLAGNPSEPDVVWLRQADGEPHTWDDPGMAEWFERVES